MTGWADAAALKARDGMGTLTTDQATAAIEAATDLLDALTMSQYGTHIQTVRPEGCGRSCDPGAPSLRATVGWGMSQPLSRVVGPPLGAGPYGGMVDYCPDCSGPWCAAVELRRPVVAVTEVRVDGQVIPQGTGWQVWDDRWLVRVDGKTWPRCQKMSADPATDPNTFAVTYEHGMAVPALGVEAVLSLAAELCKWWGYVDGECQLPKRVTSITRQGITALAIDPMDIIAQGGTGLPDADLLIYSVTKARRRGSVATPGIGPDLHQRTL